MFARFFGSVCFLVGLAAICFSGWNVYMIFTKQAQPMQILDPATMSINVKDIAESLPPHLAAGVQERFGSGDVKIPAPAAAGQLVNLVAHLLIVNCFAALGFKVGSLGTQLLRPIEVQVRGVQPA